ncbi:hypothetical protein PMZ80_007317 [Knufia obscura]|uniref:DUF7726 domain-containing protein n=2 Tax=Knufia TaxID=430999 RepID=A0AAN8I5Q0_9EURO|nr:hypothetical protein PMZ80_007317 [Knufia obscura]KAK5953329.1 hypothetical protein OHC33_005897 [Knufia fluminis]
MHQNGPHAGVKNATYRAAHDFFAKREDQGIKLPSAKTKTARKKTDDTNNISFDDLPRLDGESEGNVPVYDTCDDIRTKINAHLRKTSATQAAFCRELNQCLGDGPTKNITSSQLTAFLRKKGPLAGNTSKAFYAAYVYFEKLRLKQGKDKSVKRKEMEVQWAEEGGADTKHVAENMRFTCGPGERPWMNKYGQMEFS